MTESTSPIRFLGASVIFTIFSYLVHTLGAFLTMGYYLDQTYVPVWSKLMMPSAGPLPVTFTLYSLAFGFVFALLFVFIYLRIRSLFSGKSDMYAGTRYGFGVFLVGSIPGYLSLILLINVPLLLAVEWAFESLIIAVAGGAIVARIAQ
ncbi:MAG: hypothetical protein HY832_01980 [Candidatus Aenigmarchaeota archaeon]|nr:hypothetical protein [Candidatus Aenigmarchaeota archaeon]